MRAARGGATVERWEGVVVDSWWLGSPPPSVPLVILERRVRWRRSLSPARGVEEEEEGRHTPPHAHGRTLVAWLGRPEAGDLTAAITARQGWIDGRAVRDSLRAVLWWGQYGDGGVWARLVRTAVPACSTLRACL